jgi:hypothetical protein
LQKSNGKKKIRQPTHGQHCRSSTATRNLPRVASTHHAVELAEKKKRKAPGGVGTGNGGECRSARLSCTAAQPLFPSPTPETGGMGTDRHFCALRICGIHSLRKPQESTTGAKTFSSYKCIGEDEKRIHHSEKSLLTVETCIFTLKMHSTLMKSQLKIEKIENAPFTNRKPVKNANGLSSNLSVSWPGKFWFTTTFSSRTN